MQMPSRGPTRLTGWLATLVMSSWMAAAFAGQPALATQVVQPEKTPLERMVDGTIEAVNQGTVSAQTSGRIVEILYDVNDFVPAGAVIVRLRATEQRSSLDQAQAALKEATARETEAQTRFKRIEGLFQDRAVSRQQLDQAQADRDAAVARLASARAALESAREGVSYTEVRAPYAGVVTRRLVQVGESVQPGTPLISGLSLQYLRVNVDLPQSVVERVRALRKASIHVDGRRIEATRITVFPEAAPQSNTFRARIDLPENATDLYPGMYVKVGLVVGETDRMLVPLGALVERSEVTALYMLSADRRITLRQVRLGDRFGDRVEVLAGLSAGDEVVLDPVAAAAVVKQQAAAAKQAGS